MAFMDDSDWLAMETDLTEIRQDNEVSIIIRRGSGPTAVTLPAQKVRVASMQAVSGNSQGRAGEETTGAVTVLGDRALNIQVGDRFNNGGILFEVTFVQLNRRVAKMASARMVQ